jgi:predicted MFS family arabinose efflux permease
MTTESLVVVTAAITPAALSAKGRWRIMSYLSVLILLLGFGSPYGYLIDTPISFFLKNKLNLEAHEVADFRLIAAVPLYLSFIFGFIRDIWNPFGMRDRGFLILFGLIGAALYVLFAFIPVNYLTLLCAVLLMTIAFLFVASAQKGLTSAMGQQHVMSGQVSAVWNIVDTVPVLAAFLIGGALSDRLEGENADRAAQVLFLVGAAIMVSIAAYGLWKPRSVFDNIDTASGEKQHPLTDLKRLVRHWPVYPALLIWLMWSFAPGWQTPLQYFLQDTLHANDAQWGQWNAIFSVTSVPTLLLFGLLCRKAPLKILLLLGTLAAVPQMVPLLFIHSVSGALIAAVPMGLMGGMATAAYIDLLIRSSPKGLHGTTLMMAWGLYYIADRLGDVLGTNLYDRFGGFTACVIAVTVVYTLMLPVLLFVPKRLIATPDGKAAA